MRTLRYKAIGALLLLCLGLCVMSVTGCNERDVRLTPSDGGSGSVSVTLQGGTRALSSTTTITKEEAELFLVTLYKGEDLVSSQVLLGKLGTLTFPAGYGYRVFVENIDEDDAETMNEGWGAKRFAGLSKNFGIQSGKTTKVGVACGVANAAVAVNMGNDVEGCTVTLTCGTRTLSTSSSRTAYFNVAQGEALQVQMKVEKDGQTVAEKTLELETAKVKDINVKPSEPTDTGTIGLSITYDDTFQTVRTEIEIE